ncbi:TetR family transcriptional regulator, partial [Xanthomonas vasicola pv. vasculorum NCPPB 895]
VTDYLQTQMERGVIRCPDALIASKQLSGLLHAETLMPCLFGALQDPSPAYLRQATRRAVDMFLAGYGGEAGKRCDAR